MMAVQKEYITKYVVEGQYGSRKSFDTFEEALRYEVQGFLDNAHIRATAQIGIVADMLVQKREELVAILTQVPYDAPREKEKVSDYDDFAKRD